MQLYLVMMSKYFKVCDDIFNTFWIIDYIKIFAQQRRQQQRSSNQSQYYRLWIAQLFPQNRHAKNQAWIQTDMSARNENSVLAKKM